MRLHRFGHRNLNGRFFLQNSKLWDLRLWLGNSAVCYRLRRSRIHLGNVGLKTNVICPPLELWPKTARALIVLLVLSTVSDAGELYYVAPRGSDANDCLSPSKACATFQRAVNQ